LTIALIIQTAAEMVRHVTQLTAAVIVAMIVGLEPVLADHGSLVAQVHMIRIVVLGRMPLEIVQASTAQRVTERHRA
jgi:hypothetical protein